MNNLVHISGEQLEDAFQQFNRISEQLVDSYGDLELQVAQLSNELLEARSERLIQLAEKEELANRLEGLLETLPAGIIVLDTNNQINQTNLVAREMFGNKIIGLKWESIAKKFIISDGDALRLNDGRWINVSTRSVESGFEKIILISDITETHNLQVMLNRQRRLSSLGEMVACVAHQIRTPLASALLYVSNLNHPMNNEKQRILFTHKAKKRLLHLDRMVNDMLVFVKGDVSESEYIEASKFVLQLKYLLEPNDEVVKMQFIVDDSLNNKMIRGNRNALFSAIQNIIDNAIQSCGDEPRISLHAALNTSNQFELRINDNGCGMSTQTREKIFEPFFTTKSSGTGLGLAVVNQSVKQYDGELLVVSDENVGSCFTIVFPCVEVAKLITSDFTSSQSVDDDHVVFDKATLRKNLKVICSKGK